ncbi:MAG: hypothetical protein GY943_12200 [Chloroflexi bacterium]|nr:hypothetical protein [Chloroflexota bacterium]
MGAIIPEVPFYVRLGRVWDEFATAVLYAGVGFGGGKGVRGTTCPLAYQAKVIVMENRCWML